MKIKSLALVTSAILLTSSISMALPLLRESRADFAGKLATIYPDHDDPNLFYFLPNSSQFARDKRGKPLFQLVTKGLSTPNNPNAWGTMNFVIRAGLDEDLLSELTAFKKSHPEARLTVMPLGESFISTSKQKDGSPVPGWDLIFKHIDMPPYAGVAETEVGINTVLTGDGALIFRQAIEQTGDVIQSMNLCYKVDGATPLMEAKIYMNYKQIYHYWRATASAGWWIFGGSIGKVVEKLIRQGHIKIELLGSDATMDDLVMEVARQMAETYLKPVLTAAPGASATEPPFRLVQFSYNETYKEERTEATYVLKKRRFLTDNRCLPLTIKDLKPYAKDIIVNVD